MHHFAPTPAGLAAEAVPLAQIAAEVGTPTYVYSAATLRRHVEVYVRAFGWGRGLVAYAVKANGNLAVLKVVAGAGAGADTVSGGEIRRALAAGLTPDRIIFSGVGKTDAELDLALSLPGLQINVESTIEMQRLEARSRAVGAKPLVCLRINPDVAAGTHAKIATGKAEDKFGLPVAEAMDLYAEAQTRGAVQMMGLAVHIGSQIGTLEPFDRAYGRLAELTAALRGQGLQVQRLDLGGGLGVAYGEGEGEAGLPSPDQLGALARRHLGGLDVEVSVEPGRAIAANAGVLLARVIQVNERRDGLRFLVLDAAMNDLIRPTLYEAYHDIRPVSPRRGPGQAYEVVGPVCESGDTFARGRRLPPLQAGDLVAFMGAGAYGAAMASEYNSRPLVAEVLVDGDRFALVRPRGTIEDMLARERLPDWL